jgi:hypothetical protein
MGSIVPPTMGRASAHRSRGTRRAALEYNHSYLLVPTRRQNRAPRFSSSTVRTAAVRVEAQNVSCTRGSAHPCLSGGFLYQTRSGSVQRSLRTQAEPTSPARRVPVIASARSGPASFSAMAGSPGAPQMIVGPMRSTTTSSACGAARAAANTSPAARCLPADLPRLSVNRSGSHRCGVRPATTCRSTAAAHCRWRPGQERTLQEPSAARLACRHAIEGRFRACLLIVRVWREDMCVSSHDIVIGFADGAVLPRFSSTDLVRRARPSLKPIKSNFQAYITLATDWRESMRKVDTW